MIPVAPPQASQVQPFPASPPPQGNAQPPVTIDAVVQLLRDDRMRGFRIDVETDSLVQADQAAEKADRISFVTAIGTFFKEFGPVVQAMPPLAPLASGMLQFAVRGFKVGAELEELIEKTMGDVSEHLANPPPPQPRPEDQIKVQIAQIKAQAEGQKAAAEGQDAQVKAQATVAQAQLAQRHAEMTAQREASLHAIKEQAAREAHQREMEKRVAEEARAQHLHDLQVQKLHHEAALSKDAAEHSTSLKEREVAKGNDADSKATYEKMFAEINDIVKAPKKLIYDKSGDIIGVQQGNRTSAVKRDASGNIASIE